MVNHKARSRMPLLLPPLYQISDRDRLEPVKKLSTLKPDRFLFGLRLTHRHKQINPQSLKLGNKYHAADRHSKR